MRSIEETFNTSGTGRWSVTAKEVAVTSMDLVKVREDDDGMYGELRIYFTDAAWNTHVDGLIYTDPMFLYEVREYLGRAGYDARNLQYSEQGMQGDNFVSFDADGKFVASWNQTKH